MALVVAVVLGLSSLSSCSDETVITATAVAVATPAQQMVAVANLNP